MSEKQPKPRFWSAKNIPWAILLIALAAMAYIVDEVYLSKYAADSLWGILHSKQLLPNLANSLVAALVIFFLFEIAAAVAVSRFVKSVVTDDEVFERLFNRRELKRLIKISTRKLSGSDEFGAAASEIIGAFSGDPTSRVAVRGFSARYELSDHDKDPDYYWIDAKISYERNVCPKDFLIDAYVPKNKSKQTVHTNGSEFSWLVVTGSSQRDIASDDFSLEAVSVDGVAWNVSKVSNRSKTSVSFKVEKPVNVDIDYDQPVEVEMSFRAKQARKFGFVATTFKFLTKGYDIDLNYTNLSFVNEVWQLGHIVGDKDPGFDHRHESPIQNVQSSIRGWAMPGSGVTVTWMEQKD